MKSRLILCIILVTAVVVFNCKSTGSVKKEKGGKTILLINCGAEEDYTDKSGRVWKKDQEYQEGQWGYVVGETVFRETVDVENTEDDVIYLNERYSMESYRIPLENGNYIVKLHFAETFSGVTDVGGRIYSVNIEGKEVLKDFDPFKEAGCQSFTAVAKKIDISIQDGELTIEFISNVQNPMINGIEILQ